MAKQINPDRSEKFEIVFEKEDSTHIWKYDHTKTKNGPVVSDIGIFGQAVGHTLSF